MRVNDIAEIGWKLEVEYARGLDQVGSLERNLTRSRLKPVEEIF